MNRAAYGAAAWAILFAAMSAFWALGGTLGLDTLGNEIERKMRALGGLLFTAAARQAGQVSSGASARSAPPR